MFGFESGHFFDENCHFSLGNEAFTAAAKLLEALVEIGLVVDWLLSHLFQRMLDKRCSLVNVKKTISIVIKHLPDLIDGFLQDLVNIVVHLFHGGILFELDRSGLRPSRLLSQKTLLAGTERGAGDDRGILSLHD